MPTVLITGANRGIGLEFCRQYAGAGWSVIACCRRPDRAEALTGLASSFTLTVKTLDVSDLTQIDALASELAGTPLDVLINNAGIYNDRREQGLGALNYQDWQHALLVNTLAPVKITEAFLPNLVKGQKKLIVSITSLMGSMADNGSGGSIFYRSSKAALNAAMKTLAIDLKRQNIGVLILHPGWVISDMGGKNALISTETSVGGMRRIIDNFTAVQSGSFLKYDGSLLPW